MKLVCIADAHVHPWRLCSRDGGHDRLLDGLSAVRQSLELARDLKAVWVFAGDMKQPKTSWPQSALTGLHALFRDADHDGVEMVMVAGNHDAEGEVGCGLTPFADVATVVDRPMVVTPCEDLELVCAPWNANLAAVRELTPDPRILIAHGFLQGCALGPEDVRLAKGTPIKAYGDFDIAIFGDVHKAQWHVPAAPINKRPSAWVDIPPGKTTFPKGSALYCGSPYQQNWGERNDGVKGALVVDLENQTVEQVPLRGPQYAALEMNYDSARDFLAGTPDPAHFYRITYTGALCGVTDQLRAWGEQCRSFQFVQRREERSQQRSEASAGMSKAEILQAYVKAKPPSTPLDKTVEAGMRLVVEDAE